jgi:hypothetical protein
MGEGYLRDTLGFQFAFPKPKIRLSAQGRTTLYKAIGHVRDFRSSAGMMIWVSSIIDVAKKGPPWLIFALLCLNRKAL